MVNHSRHMEYFVIYLRKLEFRRGRSWRSLHLKRRLPRFWSGTSMTQRRKPCLRWCVPRFSRAGAPPTEACRRKNRRSSVRWEKGPDGKRQARSLERTLQRQGCCTFWGCREQQYTKIGDLPTKIADFGGAAQIWTGEWRFCRPLPYHLATAPMKNPVFSMLSRLFRVFIIAQNRSGTKVCFVQTFVPKSLFSAVSIGGNF